MRCRSSNPRVVKTIRLRRAALEPWVHQTNIKVVACLDDVDDDDYDDDDNDLDHDQVVHLVRDPRAIINSVSKRSVQFVDSRIYPGVVKYIRGCRFSFIQAYMGDLSRISCLSFFCHPNRQLIKMKIHLSSGRNINKLMNYLSV